MGNPFTSLLNDLSNPADKEILTKLSPEGQEFLSGAAMRQSDFSRKNDEYVRLKTAASTWEPWQAGQRPEWERRYKEFPTVEAKARELEQKYVTAQAEIDALKAASPNADGSIDISKLSQSTVDLLQSKLKPQLEGFVTKADLKTAMEEVAKTAWTRTAEDLLPVAMQAQELSQRYYREFGEPMSHETIIKVAAESGRKGQESLDFAWQKLAGPKLEAKRQADIDQKIKEAEERGVQKGLREAQTHNNLPPGMEEGAPGFQFAKPVESIDQLPPDYELGQKGGFMLGQLAGDELRKLGAQRSQQGT
jgi:hypothetical protein